MGKRENIIRALEKRSIDVIQDLAKQDGGVLRILIALSYDKESLICWRSIEAIGIIAASMAENNPASARSLVQRLLWMMRDESGNNPWSAPEMLGEIVRNSPEEFSDIAPIIASFHDEEILKSGVLRALVRISEIRPDLAQSSAALVDEHIRDADAVARAYAIMLAGNLNLKDCLSEISELIADGSRITIYEEGAFRERKVGEIAQETIIKMKKEG